MKEIKETETHLIYPLWLDGQCTWGWTNEQIRQAMANQLSEKQKNHIKQKNNEVQKKQK